MSKDPSTLLLEHHLKVLKLPTFVREEIVRIDHHFNSKVSVFGHWVSEAINQTYGTSMWSGDNVPTASNTFDNPSYSSCSPVTSSSAWESCTNIFADMRRWIQTPITMPTSGECRACV